MLMQANRRRSTSAHVVVLGNEKGGAGKSTIAMHVAVALMNFGQRVATIDLDLRQKSFTTYIENRRAWAKQSGSGLTTPTHFSVPRGSSAKYDANTAIEQPHNYDVVKCAELDRLVVIGLGRGAERHAEMSGRREPAAGLLHPGA